MTISDLTLKTRDEEPVRRFEVFTGTGRRRDWSDEEKAQIVAESYSVNHSKAYRKPPVRAVLRG